MSNTTMNNGHTQRKQLSSQIDRLDIILDGLAEALEESVAGAVKGVVGQVVKEAVEASIKEVLGSPDLLRAALAQHDPQSVMPLQTPKKTLRGMLKGALNCLLQSACMTIHKAKQAVSSVWSWCLRKVEVGLDCAREHRKCVAGNCRAVYATSLNLLRLAWRFRGVCLAAIGVGALAGVGSYFAGPGIASTACGLSSSAMTLAGGVLLPVWRWLRGNV